MENDMCEYGYEYDNDNDNDIDEYGFQKSNNTNEFYDSSYYD